MPGRPPPAELLPDIAALQDGLLAHPRSKDWAAANPGSVLAVRMADEGDLAARALPLIAGPSPMEAWNTVLCREDSAQHPRCVRSGARWVPWWRRAPASSTQAQISQTPHAPHRRWVELTTRTLEACLRAGHTEGLLPVAEQVRARPMNRRRLRLWPPANPPASAHPACASGAGAVDGEGGAPAAAARVPWPQVGPGERRAGEAARLSVLRLLPAWTAGQRFLTVLALSRRRWWPASPPSRPTPSHRAQTCVPPSWWCCLSPARCLLKCERDWWPALACLRSSRACHRRTRRPLSSSTPPTRRQPCWCTAAGALAEQSHVTHPLACWP